MSSKSGSWCVQRVGVDFIVAFAHALLQGRRQQKIEPTAEPQSEP